MLDRPTLTALTAAFNKVGLAQSQMNLSISKRPDLSDLQSTSALAHAKSLHKSPKDLATELARALGTLPAVASVTVDGPGFVNIRLRDSYVLRQASAPVKKADKPQRILLDYGGPNVAKPLHVGHIRSAIIGQSLNRIARSVGHKVIADIHLGDWGKPMGMLIAALEELHPDWVYFKADFVPEQAPKKSPVRLDDLMTLYPEASKRTKSDPDFNDRVKAATVALQQKKPGYYALWQAMRAVSVAAVKKDFKALNVDFDLWFGESDAEDDIPSVLADLALRKISKPSKGAVVVPVKIADDKQKIPPLLLQKSDKASGYGTTDLVTIFQRMRDYRPDQIWYVVDKRQAQHFEQVFRAAERAGYIIHRKLFSPSTVTHVAFGTMNGRDGKPFKTRAGGTMRLSDLIALSFNRARQAAGYTNDNITPDTKKMLEQIGIAAIKFGDLVNPRISDYVFDPEIMTKTEGRTGPYIQYTTVRARSVLKSATVSVPQDLEKLTFTHEAERKLAFELMGFNDAIESALKDQMPSHICQYLYRLAQSFNNFYANCPINSEDNANAKALRVYLTYHTQRVLAKGLGLLTIAVPKQMTRAPAAPAA